MRKSIVPDANTSVMRGETRVAAVSEEEGRSEGLLHTTPCSRDEPWIRNGHEEHDKNKGKLVF